LNTAAAVAEEQLFTASWHRTAGCTPRQQSEAMNGAVQPTKDGSRTTPVRSGLALCRLPAPRALRRVMENEVLSAQRTGDATDDDDDALARIHAIHVRCDPVRQRWAFLRDSADTFLNGHVT